MAVTINTDVSSLIVRANLERTTSSLQKSIRRLSSGYRINSASDDPSGMAISMKFDADVRSLGQALRNTNDGISLAQTAEGGLDQISNALSRMRELAVQASNGTLSSSDRKNLDTEFQALKSEIDRIANNTEFNDTTLIDQSKTFKIQVGIDSASANNMITISTTDVNAAAIGGSGASALSNRTVSTAANASNTITSLSTAITEVATARAKIGASISRLNTAADVALATRENLVAANSRIRDVDVAEETANYTRSQILVQSGTAILAQANFVAATALTLLKG